MLAARNLFAEHGYDATTLRQVAQRADLGLGTLFNYISDKRDLIYLVFNQEVSAVTSASLAAPRPWQTFNEKILSMMEPNYRLFGGRTRAFAHPAQRGSAAYARLSPCGTCSDS